MPKHKIFVQDYGRSSTYAIKKRRKTTEECHIVIPGSDDEDCTPLLSDGPSSSVGRMPPSFNDSTSEVNVDKTHESEDESGRDGDTFSVAYEELKINEECDIEFDDGGSDEDVNHKANQPLYNGAPISLGESMVSILTFVLSYNLTGEAIGDLLVLMSLHLLKPNILKTSVYFFRKYFGSLKYPIIRHHFCSACFSPLGTKDAICPRCLEAKGVSYFIEIPILHQLQVLFKRRGFHGKLQHRFNRKKKKPQNLEDIYDADVYIEQMDNGFLSNPDNISFTWNTDGVPIFNSSGFQIWPFYLIINELPYAERIKSENILLVGLWFGPCKPNCDLFLGPIQTALREVKEGVYLKVPHKNEPIKVRGIVICGTCDLIAKCMLLNMTQFNGKHGCPKCLLKGRSEERIWTYPFERNLVGRTDEQTRRFADEAVRTGAPVYGIKGHTLLSSFVHEPIRTTAVDSMHCGFIGNVKKICTVFFDSRYSDHPASLYDSVDLVDSRVCALAPPSFLQRRPRSIKKHLKYWKASELKAWLFYYSLPILYDIMAPEYFDHYSMLVIGLYTLHQASISPESLEYASGLLREFVNRFDVLYGPRHMSCNLHQLLHLVETVRDFGPLWVTSCFPFEAINGKIKSLVHSSRHPELQICSAVSSLLNLSNIRHENLEYGTAADDYCSKVANPKRKMKLGNLSDNISCVGNTNETRILPAIVSEALASAEIVGRRFCTFLRLRKDGLVYTAQSYDRSIKYDNTCVQYNQNNSQGFGLIYCFVQVHNCVCLYENACECYAPSYAIIQPCILTSILSRRLLRHAPEFVLECAGVAERAVAISVEQLSELCCLLKIIDTEKSYVVLPPNSIEVE